MMLEIIQQQQQMLLEVARISSEGSHRRRYFNKDHEAGHARLANDYFSDAPLRVDATGKKGLSPLQKCTAAIRQFAYGSHADHYDEYLRIGEKTFIDCLFNLCRCVIEIFGAQYLRKPNSTDIQRLIQMHEERHGFPCMLGSLDCMHYEWKNCLDRVMISTCLTNHLFNNILQGNEPDVYFTVNDTQYTKGYYLTDGIYPQWATFVKSFSCPQDMKRKIFKERQEAARKDVE
ncbi:uncharacterized protein [Henckelia pumila]|uniref:uncharacterized protein n=1 Tax=Henckelia pumila TaxID=405737 RepID=UPI003C6E23BF